MTFRRSAWALAALLSLTLGLSACKRETPPADGRAPDDPVAAVEGLTRALRDNDLVRYSRLSLPPDLYARSEELWTRRQAQAEPPTEEELEDYRSMMARLTAPDAETALMAELEPKLAKFETEIAGQWPLMQATATIFITGAIQANTELGSDEKDHAVQVVTSLMQWAQPALFTDRGRARQAVAVAARTAREIDLPTLPEARALPMVPALEKGGIAFRGAKDLFRVYGLDFDASLDGATAELLSTEGDTARVEVSYPLLGKTLSYEMELVRRDGAWYSAEAVRQVEEALAEADAATAPEGPADTVPAIDAPAADAPATDTGTAG